MCLKAGNGCYCISTFLGYGFCLSGVMKKAVCIEIKQPMWIMLFCSSRLIRLLTFFHLMLRDRGVSYRETEAMCYGKLDGSPVMVYQRIPSTRGRHAFLFSLKNIKYQLKQRSTFNNFDVVLTAIQYEKR